MNSRKLEELIRNIQAMIKCPHCGSQYTKENIKITGQMGQAILVQLDCYVCNMPVIATIVANYQAGQKIDSAAYLESKNFFQKDITEEPINSDEILALHDFLKTFNGDFEQLFR